VWPWRLRLNRTSRLVVRSLRRLVSCIQGRPNLPVGTDACRSRVDHHALGRQWTASRAAASRALLALASLFAPTLAPAVSLDVYGRLPGIEAVSLSPDGSRVAFVRTMKDTRVVQIVSLENRKVLATLRAGEQKLRGVEWADDTHILISISATGMPLGFVGAKQEWAMLQVYDLAKHKVAPAPRRPEPWSLGILNVVSGKVMVRHVDGRTILFLPGLSLSTRVQPALLRLDLQSGYQRVIRKGPSAARQWLVDADGEVVAEQDYDEKDRRWALRVRRGDDLEEVASGHAPIDVPLLLGLGATADTAVLQVYQDGVPVWKLVSLKEGSLGAPMAPQATLEDPIEDPTSHRVIGGVSVGWDGDERSVFFDPQMQTRWTALAKSFEGADVGLASASRDLNKVVVLVDGPRQGPEYVLVDLDTRRVVLLGRVYPEVDRPLEVQRIVYRAADELPIPAYLTLPRAHRPRNLPLVVMPHGGPAARDTGRFDWWSQALADQGYAVLRPNYRGSALPRGLLVAGFGEWGRKMQTDLSDGVRYLAMRGIVDPARVCIAGASYGGYAALAGVTLDAGVYRCAISIAGMSDLKRMLRWVNDNQAQRVQRYWDRFMGVTGPDDPALYDISPINHVDDVKVPLLLIHGRDDTVVPFEQSKRMFDALRHAGKTAELVELKHEDHWLSRSETRLEMLQRLVAFLRTYNPPDESSGGDALPAGPE
jgi:dipeptidyl aminopeptidase/acylaminoacyl peptidase